MKRTLIILFHFICLNLFSQETYVNNATAYYNKGELENLLHSNKSVNQITLNPDFTYEMWMRPNISCFTWSSFKGTWRKEGEKLLFIDQYVISEPDTEEIYQREKIKKYVLAFETDQKMILQGLKAKITYEYDFYSKIHFDKEINLTTDQNGKIEIPFSTIPNRDQLASIRFETNFKGRKIYGYLTENESVNIKKTEIPNSIKIVIRENPLKETITRTVTAIKKNNKIEILSINKTTGNLKDYSNMLKLEKTYTIEKL